MQQELAAEANRQLAICNACRYCEGYCAVFPALERRRELSDGDLVQLANLCHDCRDCYYACMYSPPHEFGVNPPALFSEIRRNAYDDLAGPPGAVLRPLTRAAGVSGAFVAVAGFVTIVGLTTVGRGGFGLGRHGTASPYAVIDYPGILALGLVPGLLALVVMTAAARRYWRTVGAGGSARRGFAGSFLGALHDAATLRFLRGGGEGCDYPDERPSALRRYLHHLVAYGFGLCLLATAAAALAQDFLGQHPPYAVLSVPVLAGTVGGAALVLGTVGLAVLKTRADPAPGDPAMAVRDYGLLFGLFFLGASGLALLALRTTGLYGVLLVVHLGAVCTCFLIVPATKFVHLSYRLLALARDRMELGPPG